MAGCKEVMEIIYLDNAATSWPKPGSVYREVTRYMRNYCGNPGRGGHKMAVLSGEKVYECRERLSELFCIKDPLNIVFTSNTTEAINIGLKGYLNKDDHVITTAFEHNAVLRPLKKLEREKGVQLTIVLPGEDGLIEPEAIGKYIRENTKLIIATHASNVTGTINPVKEIGDIAKRHGVLFMVDAAQTAGIVPIDVEEINTVSACCSYQVIFQTLSPSNEMLLWDCIINCRLIIYKTGFFLYKFYFLLHIGGQLLCAF